MPWGASAKESLNSSFVAEWLPLFAGANSISESSMTRKLSLQNKKGCKGEGKGQRRTVIVLFGPLQLHRLGRLIDRILI